ncbi:TolC family protein [Deinococcus cellulosilyticus]|nr:TolC family protein [Deinococcus cellulosilyticus]
MIALFMASSAFAVNPAPLASTALQKSATYQVALTEMQEATRGLSRTQSDPVALKPDLLSAQQRVSQAQAALISQMLQVRQQLLADLQNLDSLQGQLEAQQISLDIAQLNAQAARARLKAGAATQHDLNKAENDLDSAEKDVQSTKKQIQEATDRFKKRYGKTPDLSGDEKVTWKAEQLQTALKQHPRILKDSAALENADLQYQIKSSDLSPAIEAEQAKVALDNARKTYEDTLKEVQEGLEDALSQHQVAQNAVAAKEKALQLSKTNLTTQNARFQKGLISKLQVLQAQLEVSQAEGALGQARNSALKAAYSVLQAANWAPWEDAK